MGANTRLESFNIEFGKLPMCRIPQSPKANKRTLRSLFICNTGDLDLAEVGVSLLYFIRP